MKHAIKVVMQCVVETRRDVAVVRKDVVMLDNQQEGIEHRLSNFEERLTNIEEYMDTLATHMNNAIERINAIHLYLKAEQKQEEQSLLCHEEMLSSSDSEFNFDEHNPNDDERTMNS